MNGVQKASLGTRYLLKYVNNRNEAYFDVIKDCIKEVKFWALLMHFCNNMDELFAIIPDEIISRVFECKEISKMTDIFDDSKKVSYSYGFGYHSVIKGEYKTQLRLIRNCLAHGSFTFDGNLINVYQADSDFKATFDIKWFETLIMCLLSNANYIFKKGLIDYSIINISFNGNTAKDIAPLSKNGDVRLIKLTCVTDDVNVINSKFPRLASHKERINFDKMKVGFIRGLKYKIQEKSATMDKKRAFSESFKLLQKAYSGIFNIELKEIDPSILEDPEFLKLDFKEACDYLTNKYNQEDKTNRNTIELKSILEILTKIESEEKLTLEDEYSIKDYQFFLLRLYGYILFASSPKNDPQMHKIFTEYLDNIDCHYVHAHKVWSEYIKKISNALDTLKKADVKPRQIELWKDRLKLYQLRLENYTDPSKEFNHFRKLRNALTHGLVECHDTNLVFYGEEPVIKLPRLKKKTGELTEVSFQNNSRTFEIIVNKDIYLQLLDRLYENTGIEIKVNIAKYRQRKGYLES